MKNRFISDHDLIKNILNTIDCLRIEKGLSISCLATRAGLSDNTLKYIFKKRSCPSLPTISCLCRAFDVPIWQFFMLTEIEQKLPLKEHELLVHFEGLNDAHKDLLIYIAGQLSK